MTLLIRINKEDKRSAIVLVPKGRSPSSRRIIATLGYYDFKTKKLVLFMQTFIYWLTRNIGMTPRVQKLFYDKYNLFKGH